MGGALLKTVCMVHHPKTHLFMRVKLCICMTSNVNVLYRKLLTTETHLGRLNKVRHSVLRNLSNFNGDIGITTGPATGCVS